MTLWHAILIATAATLVWKLLGTMVPRRVVEQPVVRRTLDLMTISLLAGLTVVQTLASGTNLVIDGRVPAVAVAAVLFALRVPFLAVIIVAGVVAAAGRAWLGWS